jgi:arylsulfatase A-like enzyme
MLTVFMCLNVTLRGPTGKHLAPSDEHHAAAPRDRWPLGQGFERFYGFLGGETNQFAPDLE